ncbi:MAG: hypothetical protein WBP66_05035 [Azonexus sp.]
MQHTLNGGAEVESVDELLENALHHWGDIEDIPYSDVVHAAASAYKGRHG